jgi:methionyl-tRNA formyltransferase
MDEGIDTGPILAQQSVATDFSDTGKTLYDKLEEAQFELFTDFWPKFKAGQIVPRSQTDKGTYHRISDLKQLRRIEPEQTVKAGDLLNLLRAMTFPPFDNCHVEIEGKRYFLRLEITEANIDHRRTDEHGMLRQYDEGW